MSVTSVVSKSYPVFGIVKPFCTCGNELSAYFYELTAADSFREIMSSVLGENTESVIQQIFVDPSDAVQLKNYKLGTDKEADLKFCCRMTLRFERFTTLSLEDPREGVRKDHSPVSLGGALDKRKSLFWAQ